MSDRNHESEQRGCFVLATETHLPKRTDKKPRVASNCGQNSCTTSHSRTWSTSQNRLTFKSSFYGRVSTWTPVTHMTLTIAFKSLWSNVCQTWRAKVVVVMVLVGCGPETESLIHTEARGLRVQNPGMDVQVIMTDETPSLCLNIWNSITLSKYTNAKIKDIKIKHKGM